MHSTEPTAQNALVDTHSGPEGDAASKLAKPSPVGIVERLALANTIENDEVMGMANIHGCLAIVLALAEGTAAEQLKKFLGVSVYQELLSLKNPDRHLFCIVSEEAGKLLEQESAKDFREKMAMLGGEQVAMNESTPIEMQLNDILRQKAKLTEPLFKEGDINSPPLKLLLAAVAAECIEVEWQNEFDVVKEGDFTTLDGTVRRATFCGDNEPRTVHYAMCGDMFHMVAIPCKPKNGTARSMILLLPFAGAPLEACVSKLAASYSAREVTWTWRSVDIKFPRMEAVSGPKDIKPRLKESFAYPIPDIFNEGAKSFESKLPAEKIQGDAFVSKLIHFASFKADEKGAEAKAVTVAPVVVYRSMAHANPPPIEFHCTSPFFVLLVDGDVGTSNISIEFALKVTNTAVVGTA